MVITREFIFSHATPKGDRTLARAEAAERRCQALEAELQRVIAILPGPVWNECRVLVWSMLDIERVRQALTTEEAVVACTLLAPSAETR